MTTRQRRFDLWFTRFSLGLIVVLVAVALLAVVRGDLTAQQRRAELAAGNAADLETLQTCLIQLVLIPPDQRGALTDTEVRSICPPLGDLGPRGTGSPAEERAVPPDPPPPPDDVSGPAPAPPPPSGSGGSFVPPPDSPSAPVAPSQPAPPPAPSPGPTGLVDSLVDTLTDTTCTLGLLC